MCCCVCLFLIELLFVPLLRIGCCLEEGGRRPRHLVPPRASALPRPGMNAPERSSGDKGGFHLKRVLPALSQLPASLLHPCHTLTQPAPAARSDPDRLPAVSVAASDLNELSRLQWSRCRSSSRTSACSGRPCTPTFSSPMLTKIIPREARSTVSRSAATHNLLFIGR